MSQPDELQKRLAALSPAQRELLAQRLRRDALTSTPSSPSNTSPRIQQHVDESHPQTTRAAGMRFSLLFFSDDGAKTSENKYQMLLECAKYADRHDFAAVWIPERHFQPFGGLYPNPSVLCAALASITERIQLRAGSVALPLHHPVRVAEEWSMVDNLSRGRVGVSFASGWHPDDFVFAPEAYEERKEVMFRHIELIQKLWSGEAVSFTGTNGREVEVRTLPRPVQPRLPVWITSSGSAATWVRAGEIGANILAGLMGDTFEGLADKIKLYRQSLARHGFDPASRQVAVMLHTFIGGDLEAVREKVRAPLNGYLRSFMKQTEHLSAEVSGLDQHRVTEDDKDALASFAFERLFNTYSLLGTNETCLPVVNRLKDADVDEIACLVDFGLDGNSVFDGLDNLNELRKQCRSDTPPL